MARSIVQRDARFRERRQRLRRLAGAMLFATLAAGIASARWAQVAMPDPVTTGLESLSMTELIERLPPIERERCPVGDLDSAAVEMRKRLLTGARLTDEQWRRALERAHVLEWPRQCWTRVPNYYVFVRFPAWLPDRSITLTPRSEDLLAVRAQPPPPDGCGMGGRGCHARFARELSEGRHALDFELTIRECVWRMGDVFTPNRRASGTDSSSHSALDDGLAWRGEMSLDVRVSSELASILRAERSQLATEAVRRSLSLFVRTHDEYLGRPCEVMLCIEPLGASVPALKGTGVSLNVDVIHNGVLVECVRIGDDSFAWFRGLRCDGEVEARASGIAWLKSIPAETEWNPEARRGWSFCVSGRPESALMDQWGDAWWDGSFTMALEELIANGEERATRSAR